MVRVVVWDLNLDAEFELATRGAYTRSRGARELVERHRPRALELLAAGDVLLEAWIAEGRAAPRGEVIGRAWSPTPSARARLAAAGVALEAAPSLEILRRVNDREFNAGLGQTLPGAFHACDRESLLARLETIAPGSELLAKRAFGVAGRGRRKLVAGALTSADRAWLDASLSSGGLQVEPWLAISAEFALHGFLDEAGALRLGAPRLARYDSSGAFREARDVRAGELRAEEHASLRAEGERVGVALAEAGYFGPFGVDAFRYRDSAGRAAWQPRGEINARYTLGWRAPGGDEASGGEFNRAKS